jgi:pyridoxamine 5'-phosphate oxidase
VYLKQLDALGFVIYSNFSTSRKSRDLATNPYASLTFFWRELERQVRVEGPSEHLSRQETQEYFDTRPRESRIGAWASRQSETLLDRDQLEDRVKEYELRFDGVDKIPVPEGWLGLRVRPVMVEFWQGRKGRLHDRFVYTREGVDSEDWVIERLSP